VRVTEVCVKCACDDSKFDDAERLFFYRHHIEPGFRVNRRTFMIDCQLYAKRAIGCGRSRAESQKWQCFFSSSVSVLSKGHRPFHKGSPGPW
jgi:hypothetical protein